MMDDQDRLYDRLERLESERLDRKDAAASHHAAQRRTTAATRARLAATARLIRQLQSGPMDRDEVANFLQFSPSGARKYAAILIKAGIIAIVPPTPGMPAVRAYRIASAAAADAWLAAAAAGTLELGTPGPSRTRRALAAGVHLMDDDTPFPLKRIASAPAARDPLVAALFGAGPAHPPIPPETTAMQIRPITTPASTQAAPPFRCVYCGRPSWVDPSDQQPPPDYCHESDHGEAPDDAPDAAKDMHARSTAEPAIIPFDWTGGRIDWSAP